MKIVDLTTLCKDTYQQGNRERQVHEVVLNDETIKTIEFIIEQCGEVRKVQLAKLLGEKQFVKKQYILAAIPDELACWESKHRVGLLFPERWEDVKRDRGLTKL